MRCTLFWVLLGMFATGCSSYSDHMRDTQVDMITGNSASAVGRINKELNVDRSGQLPEDLEDDNALLLLERGTLLQGEQDYLGASRDMGIADQHLDWLDMDPSVLDSIGKWLYSDDTGGYRAPGYERLLLNVINMVNYMARRDFQGAKVEARRFEIMERYFLDEHGDTLLPELLGFGNYMAGLAFEGARNYRYAIRYYARAWHFGERSTAFRERLTALYRVTGYNGHEIDPAESGLDVIRADALVAGALKGADYRAQYVDGEVVVIVHAGLAPYKKAKRFPIGMALTWAARYPIYFSAATHHQASQLMVSGALKWVNFPMLTYEGIPPSRTVSIELGGRSIAPAVTLNVGRQVQAGWDDIAGPLMAAAITRMVFRGIAGATTRELAKSASSSGGGSSGTAMAVGILAQLAVEGTMTAIDTPDTRSWTTLPGTILIARTKMPPRIDLKVEVEVGGRTETRIVTPRPDNLTVVNFSKYR